MGAILTLVPTEGTSNAMNVPRTLLAASEYITAMNASENVPLPSIKSAVLKKIVTFLEKNAATPCVTIAKVSESYLCFSRMATPAVRTLMHLRMPARACLEWYPQNLMGMMSVLENRIGLVTSQSKHCCPAHCL